MDNLGEKIKQKRLQKGLSQTELANLLHVSNQLISKWETNRAVPSIEYLKQLCHCLDVGIDEMIDIPVSRNADKSPKQAKAAGPKVKKPLAKWAIITIQCVCSFLLLAFVAGMICTCVYAIVPAANKNKYISDIDRHIEAYFTSRDYFDVEISTDYFDDESQAFYYTSFLKGYVDQTGAYYSYHDVQSTQVYFVRYFDGVQYQYSASEGNYRVYEKYASIESYANSVDLFIAKFPGRYGGDAGENFEGLVDEVAPDIKYIRKIKNGYYIELGKEAKRELGVQDKAKVTGIVKFKDGMLESMSITIPNPNSDAPARHKKITTTLSLITNKPTFDMGNQEDYLWASCHEATLDELAQGLGLGSAKKFTLSPDSVNLSNCTSLVVGEKLAAFYSNSTKQLTLCDKNTMQVVDIIENFGDYKFLGFDKSDPHYCYYMLKIGNQLNFWKYHIRHTEQGQAVGGTSEQIGPYSASGKVLVLGQDVYIYVDNGSQITKISMPYTEQEQIQAPVDFYRLYDQSTEQNVLYRSRDFDIKFLSTKQVVSGTIEFMDGEYLLERVYNTANKYNVYKNGVLFKQNISLELYYSAPPYKIDDSGIYCSSLYGGYYDFETDQYTPFNDHAIFTRFTYNKYANKVLYMDQSCALVYSDTEYDRKTIYLLFSDPDKQLMRLTIGRSDDITTFETNDYFYLIITSEKNDPALGSHYESTILAFEKK